MCVSEADPDLGPCLYISTQSHGEDVTYRLTTHTSEDTQRWKDALWWHVYNMSEALNSIILSVNTPAVQCPLHFCKAAYLCRLRTGFVFPSKLLQCIMFLSIKFSVSLDKIRACTEQTQHLFKTTERANASVKVA